MDDLAIVRLCAEAMGYKLWQSQKWGYWVVTDPEGKETTVCEHWQKFDPYSGEKIPEPTAYDALLACDYNPLHDDAQAMALIRRFRLELKCVIEMWHVWDQYATKPAVLNKDLNRAICLAVAGMQEGKNG